VIVEKLKVAPGSGEVDAYGDIVLGCALIVANLESLDRDVALARDIEKPILPTGNAQTRAIDDRELPGVILESDVSGRGRAGKRDIHEFVIHTS